MALPALAGTWGTAQPLKTARQAHSATLLANGTTLVAAGRGRTGAETSAEIYSPATKLWSATGSLAVRRYYHTDTLLRNGMVLVTGGLTGEGRAVDFLTLSSAELYDPGLGLWRPTGPLRDPRDHHTATLLADGRVLASGGLASDGGYTGPSGLSSAEIYDPATGAWVAEDDPMAKARANHTATLLTGAACGPNCGKVLVVGGEDDYQGEVLASAELYNPATGKWSTTGSLATARKNHSATLLDDGSVLVAGGQGGPPEGESFASAELYHPATGKWSSTGDLADARFGQTATVLAGGHVLVTGGNSGEVIGTTEIYDPATREWSSAGALGVTRFEHTATRLPDGKILVAGGCAAPDAIGGGGSNLPCPLNSAELFTPAAPAGGGDGGSGEAEGGSGEGGGGSGEAEGDTGGGGGGSGEGEGGSGASSGGGPVTLPPASDPGRDSKPEGGEVLSADSRQRLRSAALRRCLRRVRRARPLSRRQASARERRRQASAHRRCLARHGRTPGRVGAVRARAISATEIMLSFRAPGTDRHRGPAASAYLVKQALAPIRGRHDFRRAQTLCNGRCVFDITRVGIRIRLTITDLRPGTTYYYAIAARDNVTGRVGARSRMVKATTR